MEESALYARLGQLVREHRARLNMSQVKLGRAIGLSRASIANIEVGRQHIPLHHLYRLARALEVDVQALIPTDDVGVAKEVDVKIASSLELTDYEQAAVANVVRSIKSSRRNQTK